MRKQTAKVIMTASLLAAPVLAVPQQVWCNTGDKLVAQNSISIPGDLPSTATNQPTGNASNASLSGNTAQGNYRPSYGQTNQGYGQPSPSYGQPNPSYGQTNPSYGQPNQGYGQTGNGSFVPPDIGAAPVPYATGGTLDQQQQQDIANLRPEKAHPAPIVVPANFGKRPLIGVIAVDEHGSLQQSKQPTSLSTANSNGSVVCDLNQLILPEARAKLSPTDITALLSRPDITLASCKAIKVFNCQHVLLLLPQSRGIYRATMVNLRTLAGQGLSASQTSQEANAHQDLISQALRLCKSIDVQVIAAQDSNQYHRADADHISRSSSTVHYPNYKAAKAAGLRPCPLCFPEVQYQSDIYLNPQASVPDNLPLSSNNSMIMRLAKVNIQLAYANHLSPQVHHAFVLASPEYAAFSYAGGPILVSEGLLNVLDTPGEVATVLSNEMAHLSLGHVTLRPQEIQEAERRQQEEQQKNRSKSFMSNMFGTVLGSVVSYATGSYWAGWGVRHAVDIGSNIKISFPKHYEEDADRKAIQLCFSAGYSLDDYVLTVNKLGSLYQQRNDNEWLKQHGKTEERLNAVRPLIEKLSPMESGLRAWKNGDPTLCEAWRHQVQLYLDNPQIYRDFVSAYNKI